MRRKTPQLSCVVVLCWRAYERNTHTNGIDDRFIRIGVGVRAVRVCMCVWCYYGATVGARIVVCCVVMPYMARPSRKISNSSQPTASSHSPLSVAFSFGLFAAIYASCVCMGASSIVIGQCMERSKRVTENTENRREDDRRAHMRTPYGRQRHCSMGTQYDLVCGEWLRVAACSRSRVNWPERDIELMAADDEESNADAQPLIASAGC